MSPLRRHLAPRLCCLLLGLILLAPTGALAQGLQNSINSAIDQNLDELTACIQVSFRQLSRQQRLFRTVLLGRGPAASAPQGTVWHDDESGLAWLKDDTNTWHTIPTQKVRSDREMESAVEKDPAWTSPFRRGLFSTRTTLTSSLIPPLTQAYRALQCRLETVCRLTTGLAVGAEGAPTVDQTVDGCLSPEELGLTGVTECKFTTERAARDAVQADQNCRDAVGAVLAHEAETLRLLVAYDAATRTSLQYVGNLERLVSDILYPLLWPLVELGNLVKDLARVPCFLGICAP